MIYDLLDLYDVKSGMGNKSRNDFDPNKYENQIVMFKEIFNNSKLPDKNKLSTTVNLKQGELERFDVKFGDVLLTSSSETPNELAMSSVALRDYPNTVYSGFSKRLRPITHLTNPQYMRYWFRSRKFRDYIDSTVSMTTRANLNMAILSAIKIDLPDLNTQKTIANILSSLDDKIELNNKINKNLEELAQTLYKRWFVDFEFPNEDGEPYKSSSGEMVESELGMIPKGWSVIEFGDIFDFIKGKKPSQLSKIREKGYKPYLTIANIENNERNYADTNGTVLVSKYETIMVMDGGSSGKIFYGLSGILGSTMSVLTSKRHDIKMFILMTSKFNETDIREKTTGSAIPHTDKEFVKRIKISISDEYAKLFEKMVTPMFDKIINNRFEIQNLVQIRDELLPKLMNGEIEVPIEE